MKNFKHTQFTIKMELHLRNFSKEVLTEMENGFIKLLNRKYCQTQCDYLSAINRELRKRNGLS